MKTYIALALATITLAGCVQEEAYTTEADISEANRATECPVDVTEADRANYPACN
ncbi:hypothetical protein [Aliiruegeria sabulilitoris]|uniref:hypothetical protein n=1 Tax=Aliiruegeria sabulilitoris TaxID=1510458 RepID=UPI0012E3B404|nr:hypothetical protein [Aliiruegeria sabulilitoris]